jgi:hypothetical protein
VEIAPAKPNQRCSFVIHLQSDSNSASSLNWKLCEFSLARFEPQADNGVAAQGWVADLGYRMKARAYLSSDRVAFAGVFSTCTLGLFPVAAENLRAQATSFSDSAATTGRRFYRAQKQ